MKLRLAESNLSLLQTIMNSPLMESAKNSSMVNVGSLIIALTPTTKLRLSLAINLKAWGLADMGTSAILATT